MRRGWGAAVAAVLCVMSCLLLVPARAVGPAAPASETTYTVPGARLIHRERLPIDTLFTVVVDRDRDRLLASEGADGDTVVALDLDGRVLQTISGLEGPAGLAIRGDTLYVALQRSGEIREFDATSYTPKGILASGLHQPQDLVAAAGHVFTVSACSSGYIGQEIVNINLSTRAVWRASPRGFADDCRLVTLPTRPGELMAWRAATNPNTHVTIWNISDDEPRVVDSNDIGMSNVQDIAPTPDGTRFLVAAGFPYDAWEFDFNWHVTRAFPLDAYPDSVDVSDELGGVVALGHNGGNNDVVVYGPNGPSDPRTTYDPGTTDEGTNMRDLWPRGLVFSPADAHRLFAFVGHQHQYQPSVYIDVLDVLPIALVGQSAKGDPGVTSRTTAVAVPKGIQPGDQILVAAAQSATTTVTPPAGYVQVGPPMLSGNGNRTMVYRHTATGGEGPSITLVYSQLAQPRSVSIVAYRGVDPSNPVSVTGYGTANGAMQVVAPSLDVAAPYGRLVVVETATGNVLPGGSWSQPAGMAEVVHNNDLPLAATAIADQTLADAAPTGPRVVRWSIANSELIAASIVLRRE